VASRLTAWIVVAIVAVTVIAGLIVGAQRPDRNGPASLIVINGRVYTPAGPSHPAQAVAIRGHRIVRVGTDADVERLRHRQTRVVDAHGRTVLPGFDDAHVGALVEQTALTGVDLSDAFTAWQVEQRIQAFAAAHPGQAWIEGSGWRPSVFGPDGPTRARLDALVPDRPAYLVSADGSVGWANSRALKLAGISAQTPDPPDGTIVRSWNGEPTGVLEGTARHLVDRLLPSPDGRTRLRAIEALADRAHRLGITSIQAIGATPADLEAYAAARQAGHLGLRVYAALAIPRSFTAADADRFDTLWKQLPDDALLRTGAIVLDARSATRPAGPGAAAPAALAPHPAPAAKAVRTIPPAGIGRIAAMMDRRGWQVLIEADRASFERALQALQRAAAVNPAPARGRRDRIEHTGKLDLHGLTALASAGIIDSQQIDAARGAPRLFAWAGIPASTSGNADQWQALQAAGGRLALGSGWPDAPLNPLAAVTAAIAPAGDGADAPDAWTPALTARLATAIDGYTRGAAYASFDDRRVGTIAPGRLADLVILSKDIFQAPPSALSDTVVDATIFNGELVYQRVVPDATLTHAEGTAPVAPVVPPGMTRPTDAARH